MQLQMNEDKPIVTVEEKELQSIDDNLCILKDKAMNKFKLFNNSTNYMNRVEIFLDLISAISEILDTYLNNWKIITNPQKEMYECMKKTLINKLNEVQDSLITRSVEITETLHANFINMYEDAMCKYNPSSEYVLK